MGITYDEIVHLTHKRNRCGAATLPPSCPMVTSNLLAHGRVIKRRHPKQLQEFAVKILMKWMLSEENFDFRAYRSHALPQPT